MTVVGTAQLLEELLSESVELLKMPCVIRPRAHDAAVPVLMSQSKLSNSLICQPQQRNTAGRVFGVRGSVFWEYACGGALLCGLLCVSRAS